MTPTIILAISGLIALTIGIICIHSIAETTRRFRQQREAEDAERAASLAGFVIVPVVSSRFHPSPDTQEGQRNHG